MQPWEEIIPWYSEFLEAISEKLVINDKNVGTDEEPLWIINMRLDNAPLPWMPVGHGEHSELVKAFIIAGKRALLWKARQAPDLADAAKEKRITRFLKVLHANKNLLPVWIRAIRRSVPEVDPPNAEISVETDAKVIHLQLEGSRVKKRLASRIGGEGALPIILVRDAAKDRELLSAIIHTLTTLYNSTCPAPSKDAPEAIQRRLTMEVTFPERGASSDNAVSDDSPSRLRATRLMSLLCPNGKGVRWWINSVRLADADERRQRKDLIVQTDLGDVPLKTVTCRAGVIAEEQRQRQQKVACIIVRDTIEDAFLVRVTLKCLHQARDLRLAEMNPANKATPNST